MSVRAKMKCVEVSVQSNRVEEKLTTIRLAPVFGNVDDPTDENSRFFKYTPNGEIKLGVLNPAAAEQFEPGKLYYVDFTPAD